MSISKKNQHVKYLVGDFANAVVRVKRGFGITREIPYEPFKDGRRHFCGDVAYHLFDSAQAHRAILDKTRRHSGAVCLVMICAGR